jgi:hypothetical protein
MLKRYRSGAPVAVGMIDWKMSMSEMADVIAVRGQAGLNGHFIIAREFNASGARCYALLSSAQLYSLISISEINKSLYEVF